MCGIAGVISPVQVTDDEAALVGRMNQCLVHRGPDSSSSFVDGHVALAMRRLSIIDLAGGQQPLFNEDRRLAVVCNGEIYNYVELREELRSKGHRFASAGDVETIVHLYEERGLEFLSGLRGMFALALWDREQRRLILARDRMGEKPLYWHRDRHGRLWFASEMKSLLPALDEDGQALSPKAINLFLTYQYVPEPQTMFEGVQKLPAGHLFEIRAAATGEAAPRRYWDYLAPRSSSGDLVGGVRAELEEASRIMGRADVPVGVALSGGIDSTVVAALAARTYPGTLQAFSVGYPGRPETDERLSASLFARHLGIPFFDAELGEEDFVRSFPRLVWAMDDPIGDIAAYGYYAVARLAREHGVPVLLSGLGGDELFWGYQWVRDAVQLTEQQRRRRAWRGRFRAMVGRGPVGDSRRMVFYDMHEDLKSGDQRSRAMMTPEAAVRVPAGLWMTYFETSEWDRIPLRLSDVLNRTWLVSNCLALADRMTMAHSIEMRLPLLDAPLIELVNGFRQTGLDDWRKPHKWLLIEAVKDLVPAEILSRRKQGFTPPGREWMQAVRRAYGFMVADGSLVRRGLLRKDGVEQLMATAPDGFVYKVVLLEIWSRLYGERLAADDIAELARPVKSGRLRAVST
jgi:asparagine synthase (glutamine-hydrolysing)